MITTVTLILYISMAGTQPDIRHNEERATLDACWSDARDFVQLSIYQAAKRLKLPQDKQKDMTGIGAMCAIEVDGDEE